MKTIKKIQLIAFGLFCVLFTSCQKNDEYSLMSAKIDGQVTSSRIRPDILVPFPSAAQSSSCFRPFSVRCCVYSSFSFSSWLEWA